MTTVGYGDISPGRPIEAWYAVFAMIIGGVFYGYVGPTVGRATTRRQSVPTDRPLLP